MSATPAKRKRSSRREERDDDDLEDSPSKNASQRRTRKAAMEDEASSRLESTRTPSKSQGVIFLSTADAFPKTPKSGRGRDKARSATKLESDRKGK
ncbi:hypothetical protein FRC03_008003, partial [Tulasnella sp. 419]